MSKNRFFPLMFLSISFLSACGSVVKPIEMVRGTTNNEILNGYRSFELGEAILLFMPDKNTESVGWDFRSDAPIVWLTEGYKTIKSTDNNEEFYRKGLIRINVQGIESKILRQKKDELPWVVRYSANKTPKFGVESINLFIGGGETPTNENDYCFGSLHENCTFNPEKSMSSVGITFKKICEKSPTYIGYELTHPDKRQVLARTFYSGGSGGEETSFELFFSKDKKDLCKDDEEISVVDTKPVETTSIETPEEQYQLALKQTDHFSKMYWLNLAAGKGHLQAQKVLSLFYKLGFATGTPDIEKGFYWIKKAAEQGDAESQCDFSFYFSNGEKYKNTNEEFYWIKKSVEGKWADFTNDKDVRKKLAMCRYSLALNYENGGGTPKDISKAIYWYKKSADLGFDDAKEKLITLKNESKKNAEKSSSDIVSQIMNRCKKDMGQYGSAMVKGCVDQDIKAVADIAPLLKSHPEASQRCLNDMGQYGYAMVKGCITQDINAEEALKRY